MSEFNYDQFPLDLLEHEKSRIEQDIAYSEYRCHLIDKAIGKKAVEGNNDQVL